MINEIFDYVKQVDGFSSLPEDLIEKEVYFFDDLVSESLLVPVNAPLWGDVSSLLKKKEGVHIHAGVRESADMVFVEGDGKILGFVKGSKFYVINEDGLYSLVEDFEYSFENADLLDFVFCMHADDLRYHSLELSDEHVAHLCEALGKLISLEEKVGSLDEWKLYENSLFLLKRDLSFFGHKVFENLLNAPVEDLDEAVLNYLESIDYPHKLSSLDVFLEALEDSLYQKFPEVLELNEEADKSFFMERVTKIPAETLGVIKTSLEGKDGCEDVLSAICSALEEKGLPQSEVPEEGSDKKEESVSEEKQEPEKVEEETGTGDSIDNEPVEEQKNVKVIARGLTDRTLADEIARRNNGSVISDPDDPDKFAIVVAESVSEESEESQIKEKSEESVEEKKDFSNLPEFIRTRLVETGGDKTLEIDTREEFLANIEKISTDLLVDVWRELVKGDPGSLDLEFITAIEKELKKRGEDDLISEGTEKEESDALLDACVYCSENFDSVLDKLADSEFVGDLKAIKEKSEDDGFVESFRKALVKLKEQEKFPDVEVSDYAAMLYLRLKNKENVDCEKFVSSISSLKEE